MHSRPFCCRTCQNSRVVSPHSPVIPSAERVLRSQAKSLLTRALAICVRYTRSLCCVCNLLSTLQASPRAICVMEQLFSTELYIQSKTSSLCCNHMHAGDSFEVRRKGSLINGRADHCRVKDTFQRVTSTHVLVATAPCELLDVVNCLVCPHNRANTRTMLN